MLDERRRKYLRPDRHHEASQQWLWGGAIIGALLGLAWSPVAALVTTIVGAFVGGFIFDAAYFTDD
jgi:hypothetical protein